MDSYFKIEKEELIKLREDIKNRLHSKISINIDLSRGRPSKDQVNLSIKMLDCVNSQYYYEDDNSKNDYYNYGDCFGIIEAKKLIAELLSVDEFNNVIVGGNSSLNLMYDIISSGYTHGILGNTPWCILDKIKFLCPTPGYGRHFKITEYFNFELISIPMLCDGPDMNLVKEYVEKDVSVKGIWCVPKYSNPQGIVYSNEVVKKFSQLKPAAKDFRIFWDEAYCVHDFYESIDLLEIYSECRKNGNENIIYKFVTTSKITIPGSGISGVFASKDNIDDIKKRIKCQTIGYDKINQLRHVLFLKDKNSILKLMKEHADIIRPKFEFINNYLRNEFKNLNILKWTEPKGGYFILFKTIEGCATDIVKLLKEYGIVVSDVGETHPYGIDSSDSYIRISPVYIDLSIIDEFMNIFCLCVKYISINKILKDINKC